MAAFLLFDLAVIASVRTAQVKSTPAKSDTVEAHVGDGHQAFKDERYREAAKEFQAALALNPKLTQERIRRRRSRHREYLWSMVFGTALRVICMDRSGVSKS